MKPLSERIKTFSTSQFVDWLCLACVDVREVHTPSDAQEEINKIREALTERLSTLHEQLTATTNSLTNAQEALKSAGIEADTVQAGVMELVSRMNGLGGENVALKGFFQTGINASFEGCDFFGDHMQSRALELGLVREEPYCQDRHENLVINSCDFEDGDPVYFVNETPATYAYLNAVRAEGVDALASLAGQNYQHHSKNREQQKKWKNVVLLCVQFAAQLRAGNAGKDGSHE